LRGLGPCAAAAVAIATIRKESRPVRRAGTFIIPKLR
jgi:hypothetical protein